VGGAKSYDGGKAWSSITHSKLSGDNPFAVEDNSVTEYCTCCYFYLSCLKNRTKLKKRIKYAQNILNQGCSYLGRRRFS
jgi:hypothetical protein